MSWLGSGISSFTDQLSSFTKDILNEGTQEVSDHVTELQVAKSRIVELESVISATRYETDKLRHTNAELSEKSESSELQIFRISNEYRALLHQKELEVKELKEKQHELMEHQSKATHHIPSPKSPPSLADSGLSEGDDISDNISMQREINRLSHETQHLRMQCDHWRRLAQSTKTFEKEGTPPQESDSQDVASLKAQLKVLKQQTTREKEEHQHEVAVLQDVHSQKLSTLKQSHQDEVEQLHEEMTQLQDLLQLAKEDARGASSENIQVRRALIHSRVSLLNQLNHNHIDALEVLGDIQQLRNNLATESTVRQDQLVVDRMDIANELQLALRQKRELGESLEQMESKQRELSQETDRMVEALGSEANQSLTGEIVESLERENLVLKSKVAEVREQLVLVEKTVDTLTQERYVRLDETSQKDSQWSLDALHDLVADLRAEIEEKDAIILELERVSNINQTGVVNTDSDEIDELKKSLSMTSAQISELAQERDELETSLEQLDSNNEEVIAEMVAIRNTLTIKVSTLETDVQNRDSKIEELLETLADAKMAADRIAADEIAADEIAADEIADDKIADDGIADDKISAAVGDRDEKIKMLENLVDDRDKKIKSLESEANHRAEQIRGLENISKEHEEKISSVETVVLHRDEKIRSLEMTAVEKDDRCRILENEADDKRKKVELLEKELNEKDGRIISLENDVSGSSQTKLTDDSDTSSKVKELTEKLQENAMMLNELHMDKGELKEEVGKKDREIKRLVEKLKDMREEKVGDIAKSKSEEDVHNQLEGRVGELMRENDRKTDFVSDLESRLRQLKTEYGDVKAKSGLEGEIEKLQTSNSVRDNGEVDRNELLGKIENLESELVAEKKSAEQSEKSESDLLRQVEELTRVITDAQTDLHKSEHELLTKQKQYEQVINDLQASNDSEREQYETVLKGHIDESKLKTNKTSELESKMRELDNDIVMYKNKYIEADSVNTTNVDVIHEVNIKVQNLLEENRQLHDKVKSQVNEINELQKFNDNSRQENSTLQQRVDAFYVDKNSEAGTLHDLGCEIDAANEKISHLSAENVELRKSNEKQTVYIGELEEENTSLIEERRVGQKGLEKQREERKGEVKSGEINGEEMQILEQENQELLENCDANNKEIADLKNQLSSQKSFLQDSQKVAERNQHDITELQKKLSAQVDINGALTSEIEANKDKELGNENGNMSEQINKKIEDLQQIITGKDQVIADLQKTNTSFLKLVENKSTTSSSDKLLLDIHKQKTEMQSLKSEREQMMAVLNEKTRECSSLKAEVHRLMSTVMAERTAINKLQKDNVDLQNQPQSPLSPTHVDMQKNAISKLSNLVKDKDLEIEALSMKNGSLLEVLQSSSDSGGQLNKVIIERDMFQHQVSEMKSQREQVFQALNQKHQESLCYHGEIQRLNAFINDETQKFQRLEHDFSTLKPQYEDCKKALVKSNDELINYKQKYTDLELKYGEMAQRDDIKNTVDVATYNEKVSEISRLKDGVIAMERTLNEKTGVVTTMKSAFSEMEAKLSGTELEKNSYKKQVENLAMQIHMLQQETLDIKQEFEQLEHHSNKQSSEILILKEMNDKLSLSMRDKEFEASSLTDKLTMLQTVMGENESEGGQLEVVIAENHSLQQTAQVLQQERDQLTLALKQRQNDATEFTEQLQKMKTKETKQTTELGRLREHLIKIEESYTQEALVAEEREKELRNRLVGAEDRLASSTETINSASQQASQQYDNVRAQLETTASQRDNAYLQVASLQEQSLDYKLQLCNLQMVLEEFQKEKESMLAAETERYEIVIARQQHEISSLSADFHNTQEKLQEALEGLDASARLATQLDRKEETIKALREEVQLREKFLGEAEDLVKKQKVSSEGKVDKELMKNMMLGYFHTPTSRRPEVIRTIAGVLGFTPDELSAATSDGEKSWVPGFLRFKNTPTPPTTPVRSRPYFGAPVLSSTPQLKETTHNKSFSEMFINFLERESSPPLAVRLPAEQMVEETQRQKPAYNPFTAARHATLPLTPGGRNSPHDSHPLMAPSVVTPDLPMFVNLAQTDARSGPQMMANSDAGATSGPASKLNSQTNTGSAVINTVNTATSHPSRSTPTKGSSYINIATDSNKSSTSAVTFPAKTSGNMSTTPSSGNTQPSNWNNSTIMNLNEKMSSSSILGPSQSSRRTPPYSNTQHNDPSIQSRQFNTPQLNNPTQNLLTNPTVSSVQPYINTLVNPRMNSPLARTNTPSPLTMNPSSSAILKNALSGGGT